MQTFADWISLPENRSAQTAVERVADSSGARRLLNPLFLHGPSGTGKTHLVSALLARVIQQTPDRTTSLLTANEFETLVRARAEATAGGAEAATDLHGLQGADFLVIEDVQHLSDRATEAFVQLFDRCLARGQQMVLTATTGPALLTHLSQRLTSRLANGLVVGLKPLSPKSRFLCLKQLLARRQLTVAEDVLAWLAEHGTGSFRQLEGFVARLETLTRLNPGPLDVATLAEQFRTDADAHRPTVERIVERVGSYFHVEPQKLQAHGRSQSTALPRQVSMYLARQLTKLSLREIGDYFGGRDHTTVLHACRKVEQALESDVHLSGAVRQLHADLA
jgi:chromosomal replication initiator protein